MKDDGKPELLAPCPFCGAKREWIELRTGEKGLATWCQFCGARGPVRATPDDASKAWNRREF